MVDGYIGAGSTVEVPESTNHSAGFVARLEKFLLEPNSGQNDIRRSNKVLNVEYHASAGVSTCSCRIGYAEGPIFDSL